VRKPRGGFLSIKESERQLYCTANQRTRRILAAPSASAEDVLSPGAIGGKFDFYGDERRGISVAVYLQLEFAPAHGAEKGLSEAGQTIVLPLLVAREFHAFTFVFNGELEKPSHDPSRELASGFGFAFGRSFTRKVAAMIERRTESSIDFQRDRS
jgi:hypothetical protein